MIPSKPDSTDPNFLWQEALRYSDGNTELANDWYNQWLNEAEQERIAREEAPINEELEEDYDQYKFEEPPEEDEESQQGFKERYSPRNLSLSDILEDKNEDEVRPNTPKYGKRFFDANRPTWIGAEGNFGEFLEGEKALGGSSTGMACHHGACIYNDMMSKDKFIPKLLERSKQYDQEKEYLVKQMKELRLAYNGYMKQSKYKKELEKSPQVQEYEGLQKQREALPMPPRIGMKALGYDPDTPKEEGRFIYPEEDKIPSFVGQYNKRWGNKEIYPLDRLFFVDKVDQLPSHVASVRSDGSLRSHWEHENNAVSLEDLLRFAQGSKGGLPNSLYVAPRKSGFLE